MFSISKISSRFFDFLKGIWESKKFQSISSNFLVVSLLLGIVFHLLVRYHLVDLGKYDHYFEYTFLAIDIPFTMLLIMELLSLIFVLPDSVSKSVLKQFELLSLIFLRSAFKEFSHIHSLTDWTGATEPFFHMLAYGFGALIIFIVIGFTYRLQKHIKLSDEEDEQNNFIQSKKFLAVVLFIAFVVIGINDLWVLITTGVYPHSFTLFYTILIFSDILIVLLALRYTLDYYRIFRYSAFVLATILIRISLSIPAYFNVIIGLVSAVYVFMLALSYNYFVGKENEDNLVNTQD